MSLPIEITPEPSYRSAVGFHTSQSPFNDVYMEEWPSQDAPTQATEAPPSDEAPHTREVPDTPVPEVEVAEALPDAPGSLLYTDGFSAAGADWIPVYNLIDLKFQDTATRAIFYIEAFPFTAVYAEDG